jgi:sugar transferase (PEP-CTERM system associated)
MIRIFSHFVSGKLALLFVLEALVLVIACYAGLSFHVIAYGAANPGLSVAVSTEAVVFGLGMLSVMIGMGLYHLDFWDDMRSLNIRLGIAMILGGIIAMALISSLGPSQYWGPDGFAVTVIFALGGSALLRLAFHRWGNLGTFKPRVLVLGTGSRVLKLAEFAERNPNHAVVGYVALQPATHYVPLSRVLPISPGDSLLSVVKKYGIDQIVVAVRERRGGGLPVQELLACRLHGVKVSELSTFYEREYRQVLLESLNASWMVLGEGFRQGILRASVKRLFDLVVSGLLLLLTLPVLVVAALCIFAESGLPLFYRQERVGQGGRAFTIYKLRSMKNTAESDGTPRWAVPNDDRTTRVGRIIRKLRIDELPQIINVFKGEMSFVGPRPERPFFVDQLVKQIPYYSLRHSIKPGITGWAQVRYPYGASLDDTVEKLQHDLYYVKNHTLFLDLMILIATVNVVLWGKGAR